MAIKWQKLLANLFFWAIAEATLTIVGLDNIADYSEFLLAKEEIATMT